MKYKLPDIKDEYFRLYRDKFLSMNNLKVGDDVIIPFNYHIVRNSYKNKIERHNRTKECVATLKVDDNGRLYAESHDKLDYYHLENNGLTGRSRREWYARKRRNGIYKFGQGWLH